MDEIAQLDFNSPETEQHQHRLVSPVPLDVILDNSLWK